MLLLLTFYLLLSISLQPFVSIHFGNYTSDDGEYFTIHRSYNDSYPLKIIDPLGRSSLFRIHKTTTNHESKHGSFIAEFGDGQRHFNIHNDYIIVEMKRKEPKQTMHFYLDTTFKVVEIAVVLDKSSKNDRDLKLLQYWRNFTRNLFPFASEPPIVYEWPSIYTKECPTSITQSARDRDKERGIGLIHDQIWADFFSRAPKNNDHLHQRYKDDVIIVFENDAVCRVPDCSVTVADEIWKMKTDLLYLGWCCDKNAPQCTHAYVIRRAAAGLLHSVVDVCGAAIDLQMRNQFYYERRITTLSALSYENIEAAVFGIPTYGVFTQGHIVN